MEDEKATVENGSKVRHPQEMHMKKKRKRKAAAAEAAESEEEEEKSKSAMMPTVSIAVAGSIIDNAQSLELATLLAGQIARAATIFRIDEVVVFDNKSASPRDEAVGTTAEDVEESESGTRFLVRILQYLETPQYLRRRLFPMHNSLKFVGLLPPLDAPHHLRRHEWAPFREGVTMEGKHQSTGTFVDVGLIQNVVVDQVLQPGLRVTVAMGNDRNLKADCPKKVVTPSSPREEMGLYWGYKVRYASNIGCVFQNSPFKGGYDHVIGTSEHGLIVKSSELVIPKFRHLLIAFGGLGGLEESIEEDTQLKEKGIGDIFHSYLNICPSQGSRTIRTEEAIFISLQYFQEPIKIAKENLKLLT